jgi:hypothetical protein
VNDAAPDLTRKVIGFRAWKLKDGRLHSHGLGDALWLPGPQRALCKRRQIVQVRQQQGIAMWQDPINPEEIASHPAPDPDCECGFYALHGLRQAASQAIAVLRTGQQSCVVGAVAAWGLLEVHESGFRAEWVEPLAIAIPDDLFLWKGEEAKAEVVRVAEEYGLAFVSLHELEEKAKEFGDVVPASLRPPKSDPPSGHVYVQLQGASSAVATMNQMAQAMKALSSSGRSAHQAASALHASFTWGKRRRRSPWFWVAAFATPLYIAGAIVWGEWTWWAGAGCWLTTACVQEWRYRSSA